MFISRLRLQNFRQHEATDLELSSGLTGIIGPNGAGKTTILEAIAWVMYGMPAARGSRETIKRRGAPPRARVEVEMEFTLGAHRYRVVRSLSGAELYQDGDPAPIAVTLGAVTERITRMLGMTRDEFFNTYFTGQKELAVMAAMSAPERAQFLSRVLGYERIRTAQDRLRERRSALRARLEGLQSSLPDPAQLDRDETQARTRLDEACTAERAAQAALAAADAAVAAARPRWEAAQRVRDEAQGVESELRTARVQATNAADRARDLERQRAEAAHAAGELAPLLARLQPLDALLAERGELDRRGAAVQARQAQMAQLEAARQQIAERGERIARLPEPAAVEAARVRVAAVRAELTALTIQAGERRSAWVRDAQEAQTKRQGLLDQFHELKEQREAVIGAGPDGECPTCARPLGAEYDKVLGVLERQLEAVKQNGRYYSQRIEQLKDEPPDLLELDRRQLALTRDESEAVRQLAQLETQGKERVRLADERERLVARVRELEGSVGAELAAYDAARHTEVQRLVRELEPLRLQATRLGVLAERAEALEREWREQAAQAETLAARVAELAGRAAALGHDEATYQAARAADERAQRERAAAELALVRAREQAAAQTEAVAAVGRRREERARLEHEVRATAADLALHQELDRALTDLRTDLNATLRPELSEIASGFVRELTNERYSDLELDEDYVPTLLDEGDPKQVISGGEEDVANLALRLAISQMIAERAGQPLSLLVLDEIFGSLDEERRANVVDLLRHLADRFPQVILITHIDTVREGFDRIIRVGYDAGRQVAVVRDETPGGQDVAA